jgi:hypothetical protein
MVGQQLSVLVEEKNPSTQFTIRYYDMILRRSGR